MSAFFSLSERWSPNHLLIRDKQLNTLLSNKVENPWNYWVTGERGAGKSLTSGIYATMNDGVYVIACSSRSFKDSVKNFALAHGEVPKTDDAPITIIMNVITKKKHSFVTIIFDDVDKLGQYFKRDFSPYIHDLYDRLLQTNFAFAIHVVTVFPYNKIESFLSPPAVSRLKFKPLNFPRYSKEEVKILIQQRLDIIKAQVSELDVEDGAIELLGDAISRIGGDLRKALEITRNAIVNNKITVEQVRSALQKEKSNWCKETILKLPYHAALIIGCIIEETLRINPNEVTNPPYLPIFWGAVKTKYINHCSQVLIKPQREKMLYYWLEQLWMRGWIDKFTLSKKHEWNYTHQRGIFVRLKEPLEYCQNAIKSISEETGWTPW